MLSLTTAFVTLVPLIAAQSTSSINLFLLDTDPQQLVASVISANPTSTQYLLTCPSSVSAENCGYHPAVTIGQKSGSIWGASLTAPLESLTMSYECTVYTSGASSAVCTQSLGGAAANDPGVVTTTLTGSEIQFYPATVTAGLEKLSATVSGTKALSTGTAKTSGSSSSGSLITLTGTGAASGSASKTGAGASATTSSSGARRVELGAASGVGMVIVLGFALL